MQLSRFSILSPVVKNLIVLNIACFVISCAVEYLLGYDLSNYLGLHYTKSPSFRPVQFVSYMFMHANFEHIFFNMLALWMFGNALENVWGSKRFLIYYLLTGVGAGIMQIIVTFIHLQMYDITGDMWEQIISQGDDLLRSGRNWVDGTMGSLNAIVNGSTVGASGAIFGLLLAFGMMFPESEIYIYFLLPIKAKWFVVIYGCIELFSGIRNAVGDNTAHFAHLGGMIFGYILIKYWQRHGSRFI